MENTGDKLTVEFELNKLDRVIAIPMFERVLDGIGTAERMYHKKATNIHCVVEYELEEKEEE